MSVAAAVRLAASRAALPTTLLRETAHQMHIVLLVRREASEGS